jgi:hypothetical protein
MDEGAALPKRDFVSDGSRQHPRTDAARTQRAARAAVAAPGPDRLVLHGEPIRAPHGTRGRIRGSRIGGFRSRKPVRLRGGNVRRGVAVRREMVHSVHFSEPCVDEVDTPGPSDPFQVRSGTRDILRFVRGAVGRRPHAAGTSSREPGGWWELYAGSRVGHCWRVAAVGYNSPGDPSLTSLSEGSRHEKDRRARHPVCFCGALGVCRFVRDRAASRGRIDAPV